MERLQLIFPCGLLGRGRVVRDAQMPAPVRHKRSQRADFEARFVLSALDKQVRFHTAPEKPVRNQDSFDHISSAAEVQRTISLV